MTALAPPGDPDDLQAGSAYRQHFVQLNTDFDRSIEFFERQAKDHPRAVATEINLALAYVDKIPAAGLLSQISLANKAINTLTRSLVIQPTWIAYYARAEISLYWPRSFGKWRSALADLEKARQLQDPVHSHPFYVRTWIALGDAYWKSGNLSSALEKWNEGLRYFPDNDELKRRISASPQERDAYLAKQLDRSRRVNTDLSELLR